MSSRRVLRLRYADVAATLALVLCLSGTAYAVATVGTADIQNRAVTTPKLADEAVANAKVAPDAITGSKVANHTLTLSDLSGARATGAISFTLAAHRCGYLTFGVTGAKVGQAAVMTWIGTTNPPQGVMVGPLKVVKAGSIVASACNLTGNTITRSNVGVRVITLG